MTWAALKAAFFLPLCFLWAVMLSYCVTRGSDGDPALSDFLRPADDCASPCWQRIRPGITDSLEAVEKLKAIPGVTDIYAIQGIVTNDSFVRWGWNGEQPEGVDGEREGQMWFHDGMVYAIDIPLTVSLRAVWGAFGAPEAETALKAPLSPPQVFYRALYFDHTVEIRGTVVCPLNPYNLLATRVDAHIVVSADAAYPAIDHRLLCERTTY
jgi:hypothetical protein